MKLVVLDRDGVINYDSDAYIKTPEEWIPIPGSLEAIARLTKNGYTVCIATNQAGLARGLFDVSTLERIHDKMHTHVIACGGRIAHIAYCPHHPDDACTCRKPQPGLLRQIAEKFDVALEGVPFVGDSDKDLLAAHSVGALPVLVRTGNGAAVERVGSLPAGTVVYADLAAAVAEIIDDTIFSRR